MTHDSRFHGGQEYAPVHEQKLAAPQHEPSMRPAPVYAPQVQAYAPSAQAPVAPPAPPTVASSAAVAAAGGVARDDGAEVVELSRAYSAHGEPVKRLVFRKPTGLDLRKYGYPIRQIISPDTGRVESVEINAAIAAKYVVALSSPPIPPSTLDSMDVDDADACNGAVVRFFMR